MAVEEFGGPRFTVQLGKMPPSSGSKLSPKSVSTISSFYDSTLSSQTFARSSLTPRDAVLLLGCIGELENLSKSADIKSKKRMGDVIERDEFTCEECGDEDVFIPNSFGAPKEMYGETVVSAGKATGVNNGKYGSLAASTSAPTLSNNYIKSLVTSPAGKTGVWSDDLYRSQLQYYSQQKNAKFLKDLESAYEKITLNGAKYVGGESS